MLSALCKSIAIILQDNNVERSIINKVVSVFNVTCPTCEQKQYAPSVEVVQPGEVVVEEKCKGTTQKGARCTRNTKTQGYCNQHYKIYLSKQKDMPIVEERIPSTVVALEEKKPEPLIVEEENESIFTPDQQLQLKFVPTMVQTQRIEELDKKNVYNNIPQADRVKYIPQWATEEEQDSLFFMEEVKNFFKTDCKETKSDLSNITYDSMITKDDLIEKTEEILSVCQYVCKANITSEHTLLRNGTEGKQCYCTKEAVMGSFGCKTHKSRKINPVHLPETFRNHTRGIETNFASLNVFDNTWEFPHLRLGAKLTKHGFVAVSKLRGQIWWDQMSEREIRRCQNAGLLYKRLPLNTCHYKFSLPENVDLLEGDGFTSFEQMIRDRPTLYIKYWKVWNNHIAECKDWFKRNKKISTDIAEWFYETRCNKLPNWSALEKEWSTKGLNNVVIPAPTLEQVKENTFDPFVYCEKWVASNKIDKNLPHFPPMYVFYPLPSDIDYVKRHRTVPIVKRDFENSYHYGVYPVEWIKRLSRAGLKTKENKRPTTMEWNTYENLMSPCAFWERTYGEKKTVADKNAIKYYVTQKDNACTVMRLDKTFKEDIAYSSELLHNYHLDGMKNIPSEILLLAGCAHMAFIARVESMDIEFITLQDVNPLLIDRLGGEIPKQYEAYRECIEQAYKVFANIFVVVTFTVRSF